MDKFGEMKVFVHVVEAGGFSGAARAVGLTPSAVSKLIARLEDRLGVLLFNRSPRTVVLTREGEQFYAQARHALRTLDEAEASVARATSSASGLLRVYALPTFARYQLAPLIPAFLAQHPTLSIEFQLSNEPLRMLDSGIDVAIQSGALADSSFMARKIGSSRWRVCASPEYLARRGSPAHPRDLHEHECLNFSMGTRWNSWPFRMDEGISAMHVPGRLTSNQGDMLLALARAGAGIVRLAEFHIGEDLKTDRLVPLLDEFGNDEEEPIYAVYHSRRHLSPRVGAFLDFLSANFGANAPWKRV